MVCGSTLVLENAGRMDEATTLKKSFNLPVSLPLCVK